MGRDWLDLSEKLRSLGDELEQAGRARRSAEATQQEADRLRRDYEQRLAEFGRWQTAEKAKLDQSVERLLHDTRRDIENLVRQIRERNADHESIVAAKQYVAERLRADGAGGDGGRVASDEGRVTSRERLAAGDTVRSKRFGRDGTVVVAGDAEVVVAFDSIRMALEPADLQRVAGPDSGKPAPADGGGSEQYRFEPLLDVRGMDRQDAEQAVGRFLDDARVAGVTELSILHGKGTGALRRMLWEVLRRDRGVENLRLAEQAEGGMGVTHVRLKGGAG
jgi:DNA mismatch repair protein MutS2